MREHLLHIANNYVSSTVHADLVSAMSRRVRDQDVVVPVRDPSHSPDTSPASGDVSVNSVVFSNRILRFFPLLKVVWVFCKCYPVLKTAAEKSVSRSGRVDVVAHNFWSDGMVAFLLSFFWPTRYLLVVRNTDMNVFIPGLPHYRWLMRWLIKRSFGLVFISGAHHARFCRRWPGLASRANSVRVVPNALSDWWLDQLLTDSLHRPNQACFVGKFNRNKNLGVLLRAGQRVYDSLPDFRLVLVGGSKSELLSLTGRSEVPAFVEVYGHANREELRAVYRQSRVFVMPSLTETFGLVYVEALSQGCAVICSKGEGIDGMWNEPFVRAVNPASDEGLAETMLALLRDCPEGIPVSWAGREIGPFSWDNVADKYLEFFS